MLQPTFVTVQQSATSTGSTSAGVLSQPFYSSLIHAQNTFYHCHHTARVAFIFNEVVQFYLNVLLCRQAATLCFLLARIGFLSLLAGGNPLYVPPIQHSPSSHLRHSYFIRHILRSTRKSSRAAV